MAENPALHQALGPIEWLLGKWRSTDGVVFFPTITTVAFNEEVDFSHEGLPVLNYSSFSRDVEKGKLLHRDSGFLRIDPDTQKLALVVAHFVGCTELCEGEVSGKKITLEYKNFGQMSFLPAPTVTKILRVWQLHDDDTLTSAISMGTIKTPFQEHFRATYKRVQA